MKGRTAKDEERSGALKSASYLFRLGVAVVACIYCLARWWRLDGSCLGFDEIFSVHAATHEWRGMIDFIALDLIHPPLFYAFLKIWIDVGGESLWWLRLFPFAWSIAAIAPLLLLCRELKLRRVETLTAFLFVATNGALIRYAQEVRMYAVVHCLALFSLWLFVKFLNSNSKTVFVCLFLVNLSLVYTHYFGWLLVATEASVVCLARVERLRRFLVSTVLLVVCFAVWIYAVWRASLSGENLAQNIGWQARPDLRVLSQFWMTLSEPFYYRQSSADAPNFTAIALPVALMVGAIVLGYITFGLERFEIKKIFSSHAQREQFFVRPQVLCFMFASVPIITTFVGGLLLPYSIWGTRHLIFVFVPFALLVSIALWRLPHRTLKIASVAALGWLICTGALLHFRVAPQTFIWCGWENLVERADEFKDAERTVIYVFEDDAAYTLWYQLRKNPRVRIVSVDGYADMPEDRAYFLPRGFAEVKIMDKDRLTHADLMDRESFWLAFRDRARQPDKQVLRELAARGYLIGQPLEFRAQSESAFLIPVERARKSYSP